ncbi:MAG: undecaprenyl-diphosphate phosphatase [Candidatus Hydrogenedentota bacterium]
MTLLQAAILGIIQGLTEYLPISSTAHLRIVPAFLGWSDPGAAYTAVIQLGTLLAVLIYFRKDLASLARGSFRDLRSDAHWGQDARTVAAILAGTLPIGIAGILFKKSIESTLRGLPVIAGSLILLAVILAWAERAGRRNRDSTTLGFGEIQIIGLAQALALIPGASRSGTTLTAALFLGLKRDEAARFSFLLGIPAITAAGLFELKHLLDAGISSGEMDALVVGTIAAFVSGWIAIEGLLRFLKTRSTLVFIVYRIALGFGILGML